MYSALSFLGKPILKGVSPITENRDLRQSSSFGWLQYRITSALFIVFSVILTGEQLLLKEKKFNCIQGDKDDDDEQVNVMVQFCFMRGGFTNLTGGLTFTSSITGYRQPPAVRETTEMRRYLSYYLWVPLVLVLQAILFYAPHILTKLWEHPTLPHIIDNLTLSIIRPTEGESDLTRKQASKHMTMTLLKNNVWAAKMLFVEFIYVVNPILNFFFIDYFLKGDFVSYGSDTLNYTMYGELSDISPTNRIFPIMSKCTFHKYGPSGTIRTEDLLCILPMNIVNAKIYLVLWYWLLILTVVAFLSFATSLLLTFSKSANLSYFERYCVCRAMLKDVMKRSGFGDKKLLRIVAKTIGGVDRKTFNELVEDLWHNTMDKDRIGQGGIIGVDRNQNSVIGPGVPDTDIPLREVRQRKNLTSHNVANAPQQINADAEERSRLIANMNQPPKVD